MTVELPHDLLQAADELDYVEAFQRLADVDASITEHGPDVERLLRKAWLQVAIGDPHGAAATATRLTAAQPMNADAAYVQGEALLRQALIATHRLVGGPGRRPGRIGCPDDLLERAHAAFARALRLHAGDLDANARLRLVKDLRAEAAARQHGRPTHPRGRRP